VTQRVKSADGTCIAFERVGRGEPVILVDAALCWRGMGPSRALAELLAPHFTVVTYDRRGRGDSADTAPYSIEREVEDIAALVGEVGGSACLWGTSSGAVLALEAATRLEGVRKLAMYEAPLALNGGGSTTSVQWDRIDDAIALDKRGTAVAWFLRAVGVPRVIIALMRLSPMWAKLSTAAHTLPYDGLLMRDYQGEQRFLQQRWQSVTMPTLVTAGGRSSEWMRNGNRSLAAALPKARYHLMEGQSHVVKPKVHAPTLVEFFTS
jgi:pimeloyl-ACP methyl ester carboxylesterase